jgi:hypothetical protein
MKQFLLISFLAITMATSVSFASDIPTVSAHAFASCGQDQCNGQDPSKLGCVPGSILRWYQYIYTKQNPSVGIGSVEQWYSPTCNAIWTNIQTLNNVKDSMDVITQRSLDNKSESFSDLYTLRQNAHTPMLGFWGGTCYYSAGGLIIPIAGYLSAHFTHCYQS